VLESFSINSVQNTNADYFNIHFNGNYNIKKIAGLS